MTDQRAPESTRTRKHLADERTPLAWVRTVIALMGLGFVVDRLVCSSASSRPKGTPWLLRRPWRWAAPRARGGVWLDRSHVDLGPQE